MEFSKVKREIRLLSKLDFMEFKNAAVESIQSNIEYLWFGEFFDKANLIEMLNEYSALLANTKVDHYGFFEGGKLIGHIGISYGQGPLGVEMFGWVRKGFQNKGIGEEGLKTACYIAFELKEFNYITLDIDETNGPSRAVAEKVGFIPLYKYRSSESPLAKTFITYCKISPFIYSLARKYRRNVMDIMNCPATRFGYTYHLLRSDSVIDFYKWPFPKFDENAPCVDLVELFKYQSYINLTPEDIDLSREVLDQEAAAGTWLAGDFSSINSKDDSNTQSSLA